MNMKRRIISKILGIAVAFLVMGAMFGGLPSTASAAATIYVPDDYSTIQAAVDAASPGDTILVASGNYTENIDVSTANLTIQSENGANSTIVQAANTTDHVFEVTADYVNLSGFAITGASEGGVAAVYLQGVASCSVSHNIFSNNWVGVFLLNSNGNAVEQNLVSSHGLDGILLQSSHYNTICENIVSDSVGGIRLGYSTFNKVVKNRAYQSMWHMVSSEKC